MVETINLKGNEYATVPQRLKEFREDCPRASIVTTPTITDDTLMVKAEILKDKADVDSASSTGHSYGKLKADKAFEKLETVAVGRALSLLGYLNNGQVASTEEMDEFNGYKEEKVSEAIDMLSQADSVEVLKEMFLGLGNLIANKEVVAAKDKRKKELTDAKN